MKRRRKHLACRFGDHQHHGLRDLAPDKTPITFFHNDGRIYAVVDVKEGIARAYRRLARQAREHPDADLSRAVMGQIRKTLDEQERGF